MCTFAEGKLSKHRRIALEILRNFAFNTNNRSALQTSTDFLRLAHYTLSGKDHADHLLITVAIWKLIAQHTKAKNIIKNSSLFTQLQQLKETVGRITNSSRPIIGAYDDESAQETIEDLSTALDCVLNILQA